MNGLRVGELARMAGVKADTLRFYEKRGLLPKPPRLASGYRQYPAETVALVRFIQRAQELGFSLQEVKDLLDLREVPQGTWGDAVVLVEHKVEAIDAKVSDLRAMRAALLELRKGCTDGAASINRCAIIEALIREEPRRSTKRGEEGRDGNRRRT